ncbi:MAG: hypothetical protein KDA85_13570, partial [Planctomycetaceae bacterium]|nr:hypothetical protein [Planctomycetaceae bacterium]
MVKVVSFRRIPVSLMIAFCMILQIAGGIQDHCLASEITQTSTTSPAVIAGNSLQHLTLHLEVFADDEESYIDPDLDVAVSSVHVKPRGYVFVNGEFVHPPYRIEVAE